MRRMNLKWLRSTLGIVAVASLSSCVKREPLVMPALKSNCTRTVLAKDSAGLRDRALVPDTWFSMILSNYDPLRKRSVGRPRHCDGTPVRVAPFPKARQCKTRPFLSDMVVSDSDRLNMGRLVRETLNEREELVWLQTHVDKNQDALGPLVRVEWGDSSVTVHPMGNLAAHRNAVQLRVASDDSPVLAVESDRCDGGAGKACERELRVRVLVDGKFENLPMVAENNQCLGEFAMKLTQSRDIRESNEWTKRHVVSRSLQDIAPDGLVIAEDESIEGIGADARRTQLRQANFKRRIWVRDDHVFVDSGFIEELDRRYPKKKNKAKRAQARR